MLKLDACGETSETENGNQVFRCQSCRLSRATNFTYSQRDRAYYRIRACCSSQYGDQRAEAVFLLLGALLLIWTEIEALCRLSS